MNPVRLGFGPPLIGLMLGIASFLGCSRSAESKTPGGGISYPDAFPGVTFKRPVFLGEIPAQSDAFLVLEQAGGIQVVRPGGAGWRKSAFGEVDVTGGRWGGDERGLLGFAFHPRYPENRKYYVCYVKGSRNLLAEGLADSTLRKDSGAPLRILLSIPDPYPNHNGGTIAFGPKDGFLYIGMGDGGSGGDPEGNGQNKSVLLGKMLRIDVDSRTEGKAYGIPKDNPFLDGSGAPEVWAYGLRNPWKWSFDPLNGDLWAGDVGQNQWEEIDRIEKGGNYGWNVWEGEQCYLNGGVGCELAGHRLPVHVYGRDVAGGVSVTGGVVYRGRKSSPYYGKYLFGDYGSGNVWSMDAAGAAVPMPKPPEMGLASFNTDSRGNVYLMGIESGTIYRMKGL